MAAIDKFFDKSDGARWIVLVNALPDLQQVEIR
jgi:hypothetical protein